MDQSDINEIHRALWRIVEVLEEIRDQPIVESTYIKTVGREASVETNEEH